MPINVADGLPAKKILHEERIFALEDEVARNQQIRPLKVAILNLMPTKICGQELRWPHHYRRSC